MILNLYSVRDDLVGFGAPFLAQSDAVAMRMFKGSAQASEPNVVNTYPENKSLWIVGSFDDQTGKVEEFKSDLLCRAVDVIRPAGGAVK